MRGQWAALAISLGAAEPLLDEATVFDGMPAPVVRGHIDALWSDYYFHRNEEEPSLAHARRALACLPEEHYFVRGIATLCTGVMRYQLGDGPAAVAELRAEWAKSTPASAVYTGRVLISLMSNYRAAARPAPPGGGGECPAAAAECPCAAAQRLLGALRAGLVGLSAQRPRHRRGALRRRHRRAGRGPFPGGPRQHAGPESDLPGARPHGPRPQHCRAGEPADGRHRQ